MAIEDCDKTEEEIYKVSDRYLVFIDETGDSFVHNDLSKYDDPTVFPVMTITALIIKASVYKDIFVPSLDDIKQKFWNSREVHFHSNEIRRKDGIFKVLIDETKYRDFKISMTKILENSSVTIVSSSINKKRLLNKVEKFKAETGSEYDMGDLYLTNVSWVERYIFTLMK
jgi:hypothetical protein